MAFRSSTIFKVLCKDVCFLVLDRELDQHIRFACARTHTHMSTQKRTWRVVIGCLVRPFFFGPQAA